MNESKVFIWIFNFISMILNELYQHAGESIIMAILITVCMQDIEDYGIKKLFLKTANRIRKDKNFRMKGYTALYVSLLTFETILGRSRLDDPLINVIGNWSFRNFDNAENFLLFIPFGILFSWHLKLDKTSMGYIKIAFKISLLTIIVSISIELMQFVFSFGTFQLTDIVMNWLGGTIGAILFLIVDKVKRNSKKI